MIHGVVNPDLEPTLTLDLFGPGGQTMPVVAVIDTGYSGLLSLPPAVIAALGLLPLAPRVVRLADQSSKVMSSYESDLLWDGQMRTLRVLALDGDPLVGTALLHGYDTVVILPQPDGVHQSKQTLVRHVPTGPETGCSPKKRGANEHLGT